MSIDLEPVDQQWLDGQWPTVAAPRCRPCGAVGTDPVWYPEGRWHWTLEHDPRCRLGRAVARAQRPRNEFDYLAAEHRYQRGEL